MSSRNGLHAALLKAEMRGDSALVADLKKQVAELEPVTSAAPKATSSLSLSLSDRNKMHARILKAELLGDAALVQQLKSKLSEAETVTSEIAVAESPATCEPVRTMHVVRRVPEEELSVKQLARKEKTISALKDSIMFVSSSVKAMDKRNFNPDDEYDIEVKEKRHKSEVMISAEREDTEEQCDHCLPKQPREQVLAIGHKVFLALGRSEPLLDGHCFIRSISHCDTSVVSADEDTLSEINHLKKKLVEMHRQNGKSVVFSEIMKHKCKKYDKHLVIECFPIRESLLSDAKMFFKVSRLNTVLCPSVHLSDSSPQKSILECEAEWSMNKKLVEVDGKELSRVVPKALPYFWVSHDTNSVGLSVFSHLNTCILCVQVTFGEGNNGYAHVIEEEDSFATYFAAEVIGGILDIEPRRWRKPRPNFHRNKNEVLQMKAEWKKFDPFANPN